MSFPRYFSLVRSALPHLMPLMRDPHIPQWLKASTVAAALLIVSPFDLLGDIPILGIFDDVALLALLTTAFVHFATSLREGKEEPMRVVTPTGLPSSKKR